MGELKQILIDLLNLVSVEELKNSRVNKSENSRIRELKKKLEDFLRRKSNQKRDILIERIEILVETLEILIDEERVYEEDKLEEMRMEDGVGHIIRQCSMLINDFNLDDY